MGEKYRRPDIEGGYIYDKNDIEYYRATQRNDVIDNGLLGDYNMVGAYVVNNAIVAELLALKKVYTDTFGKSIFCESLKLFDGKPIKFRLNINSGVPSSTKVTASLELMEDIRRVNGFYSNTNIVLLATKVYDDKADVNQKIFKDFNISQLDRDESGAKVENNYDVRNILLRQDHMRELQESAVPVNAKLEKKLFEKRMKVLLSTPECASLIEEFNRQIFHCKDKFLNKNDKNYYRFVNQVLDSALQMRGFELVNAKIWKQLKEIGLEYAKELNQNLDMVYANQEKLDELRHEKDYKKVESKVAKETETAQKQEAKEEKPKQEEQEEKPKKEEAKEQKIDFTAPSFSSSVNTKSTIKTTGDKKVKASTKSSSKTNADSLLESAASDSKEKGSVNSLLDEASNQYIDEEENAF